jgi:cardiolipin synthase
MRFTGPRREVLAKMTRRDHKKALVVDSAIGFTGGLNISDDYAPVDLGGAGWRDTHLRIEGPAAVELDLRHGRADIRDMYRGAISGADERVFITNAYFLPTLRLLGNLTTAARRGVDVRIIVAGTTDVTAVLYASRALYNRLLASGVRIFEWHGRVLHAKTAVVDGRWSTVGSSNLDHQSLRHNLEINAVVEDIRFASMMEDMFASDLRHCREIKKDEWREAQLPWERAASWGLFLLRDWL